MRAGQADHACLIDGARLAGAELRRYPHGDSRRRAASSKRVPAQRRCSRRRRVQHGWRRHRCALSALCPSNGRCSWSTTHGLGVLGPRGRRLASRSRYRAAPCSWPRSAKRSASPAPRRRTALIDGLVQFARACVYDRDRRRWRRRRALAIAPTMHRVSERLARHVAQFRDGASARPRPAAVAHADPARRDRRQRCGRARRNRAGRGRIFVPAIRPPTVPRGARACA